MRKAFFLSMCVLLITSISFSHSFAEGDTKTESGAISGSVVMNNWGSSEANFSKIVKKDLHIEFSNEQRLFREYFFLIDIEQIILSEIGMPKSPTGYVIDYFPESFSGNSVGDDYLTFYEDKLMAYYTQLYAMDYQYYVKKLKSKYSGGYTHNFAGNGFITTVTAWNHKDTQIFLVKSNIEPLGITRLYIFYFNSPMVKKVVKEVSVKVKADIDKAKAAKERSKKERLKKID